MNALFLVRPPVRRQKYETLKRAVLSPYRCAVMLFLMALLVPFQPVSASSLDQLKLAYLYKILAFISLPQSAESRIDVVVVGGADFGADLYTLDGKKVGGKSLVIRSYKTPEDLAGCEVVFIAGGSRLTVANILQILDGRSCLTVGDRPNFVDQGGMVGFVIREGKLLFEVNQKAVVKQGLRVNSNLLEVASRVIR